MGTVFSVCFVGAKHELPAKHEIRGNLTQPCGPFTVVLAGNRG